METNNSWENGAVIRCIHVFLKPLRKCSLPSVGHVWSNEVLYTVGSSPGSTFRWMLQSSYMLLGRWAAWSRHTSCLSSWLSTLRRSSTPTSSPSFRLLCRSSFMYSQALDKIPPLLWNRTIKLQPLLKWAGSHVHLNAHLSRLGVVDVTVWNGLRQLHDPVVDLVPAPPLNCRWHISLIYTVTTANQAPAACLRSPSLCWARRFSSLEARGASCFLENTLQQRHWAASANWEVKYQVL